MANNCLKTQLKSVVQNDNLIKLGVIRFSINVDNTNPQYRIHAYENNKSLLTIISGPDGGQITGKGISFYLDDNYTSYAFSVTGKYTIEITEKYNISDLFAYKAEITTEDLKYSPIKNIHMEDIGVSGKIEDIDFSQATYIRIAHSSNLTGNIGNLNIPATLNTLSLNYTGVTGSIAKFSNNTTIESLQFDMDANIGGDLSSIAGCSNLSVLNVRGTQVSGSLASLLDNGSLKNPRLQTLNVNTTPNLTKNAEDVTALRNLGVNVTV